MLISQKTYFDKLNRFQTDFPRFYPYHLYAVSFNTGMSQGTHAKWINHDPMHESLFVSSVQHVLLQSLFTLMKQTQERIHVLRFPPTQELHPVFQ